MMPLPQWRANPRTEPEALHKEGSHVMALYPQTTCFYKGIVAQVPDTPSEVKLLFFRYFSKFFSGLYCAFRRFDISKWVQSAYARRSKIHRYSFVNKMWI